MGNAGGLQLFIENLGLFAQSPLFGYNLWFSFLWGTSNTVSLENSQRTRQQVNFFRRLYARTRVGPRAYALFTGCVCISSLV
jgi:hypothetical protein